MRDQSYIGVPGQGNTAALGGGVYADGVNEQFLIMDEAAVRHNTANSSGRRYQPDGDEEEEENEQFSLRLFNPQGAFLATPSATGTIKDDDGLSLQIWLWWRQAAASRSSLRRSPVSRTSVAVG